MKRSGSRSHYVFARVYFFIFVFNNVCQLRFIYRLTLTISLPNETYWKKKYVISYQHYTCIFATIIFHAKT